MPSAVSPAARLQAAYVNPAVLVRVGLALWGDGEPPRELTALLVMDSDDDIARAIRYVEENPCKEGKPRQHWWFVAPWHDTEAV